MEELAKINRVIDREWPEAQRETLLVKKRTGIKKYLPVLTVNSVKNRTTVFTPA